MNCKRGVWKDVTSYSRDDKERKPTTFEAMAGALRIVVTCGHVMYRPTWVMHCYTLSIDTRPLDSKTQEQAEAEAMDIVFSRLAELTLCAEKLRPIRPGDLTETDDERKEVTA